MSRNGAFGSAVCRELFDPFTTAPPRASLGAGVPKGKQLTRPGSIGSEEAVPLHQGERGSRYWQPVVEVGFGGLCRSGLSPALYWATPSGSSGETPSRDGILDAE
jgi:hypothetical protein